MKDREGLIERIRREERGPEEGATDMRPIDEQDEALDAERQRETSADAQGREKTVMQSLMGGIFKGKITPPPKLLAITPPRTGERTLLGVENALQSIAIPEPFALELAGDADGVTLMARCRDKPVVEQQIAAHYPQALIQEVPLEQDPLRMEEGDQAWSKTLRIHGPEFLPLRTFKDADITDQGSDPLIALIGSLSALQRGERVVAQLRLNSLGPDWSEPHRERALRKPEYEPRSEPGYTYQTKPLIADGFGMAALGLAALVGLRSYIWIRDGELWKAVLLDLGVAAALVFAGWAYWRIKKARRASKMHDPILIKEKTSRIAFEAQLEITAILPDGGREERARDLLDSVAAAYHHYDNAAGSRFKGGKVRPVVPVTELQPPGQGLLQSRDVLGVREAAALWHPPGAKDELPLVERSGAKVLLPSARGVQGGALVGDSTAGTARKIHFPDDLLRRHGLYVARTRMGKSTLMHHVVVHKMREKAAGRDDDAIVVIDPHTDLVSSLIEQVPEEIADRVRLIDLADDRRTPGINLLDTRVFADRDRTADSVVRVARGLWDQWGPRMQSILEQVVKTLHEANERVDADEQSTILDGLRLLSNDGFRGEVLGRIEDPYILEWWERDFGSWHRQYRAEALAPVQTRLSYYASSRRARAIPGQPRSTIDIRSVMSEGGVLLVSTSQATAGRDVAALVGASLINLVDAVIREQGSVSLEQRRGALVVVDEMQTMPGVDYESMLSELGKFGASFILATQSLSKLRDISPGMEATLLANVGCLAVFQVAAADARQLVWELGKERVSEEDITSQPVHHCYVRATVGTERLPAFSMAVRKPTPGDPETAARIREAASEYAIPAEAVASREAEAAKKGRSSRTVWPSSAGALLRSPATVLSEGRPSAADGAPTSDEDRTPHRRDTMRTVKQNLWTLERLAAMTFVDRLELADITGRLDRSTYDAVADLEDLGLVGAVRHSTEQIPSTRRFYVTTPGLHRLIREDGMAMSHLLRTYPVSAHWMRILLQRLDAVAAIYRLAASAAYTAGPVGVRWFRNGPLDAAIILPNPSDGAQAGRRTVGVVRQGLTSERTAFSKRLWRLLDGPLPGGLLMLVPDEVRLRQARRTLMGARIPVYVAQERDAVHAALEDPIWHLPSVSATVDLTSALSHVRPGGILPKEHPESRIAFPHTIDVGQADDTALDCQLPALLKPAEKRILNLLADWPWITPGDLGRLIDVTRGRVSQVTTRLERLGLVTHSTVEGRRRLALGDRGIVLLARRDRASVGLAVQRASVGLVDDDAPLAWRNVVGTRSRQLLRNIEHTEAVHKFVAGLAVHARSQGAELVQVDPPRRAARYFRHDGTTRSIRPDAFGILREGDVRTPFFLEWERRALHPSTMAARMGPYLRYFSSQRPIDDHGTMPLVLIVFDDALAAARSFRVTQAEIGRARVHVPLFVSHRRALEEEGPLGPAWRTPNAAEASYAFKVV